MRFLIFFILIGFIVFIASRAEDKNYSPDLRTPNKRLIVDTDAGSDDGVAILNLLGAERRFQGVRTELITAVRGNTHVDNVGRNVLKILKTVNRLDIPVYKGANDSILYTPEVGNYFGKDGFGDFHFPDPPSEDLIQREHAAVALIRAVSSAPEQLTLVCLGPLTNIALAVRLDPTFLGRLKEIFILGGADSGVGNVKPGVEFNVHVDPEAAKIVLSEAEKIKKVLNVVPWETAYRRSTVEMSWRKNVLGTVKSPQVSLINKAEKPVLNGVNWISSDAILSSVVIDSGMVASWSTNHIDVEVCGFHSRGSFFVDYNCCDDLTENVRLIERIHVDKYKKMLLDNLDNDDVSPVTRWMNF